ncbi:MAG TPA: CHASE2 domain-containing protein [Drouetiella sp.]
MILIVSLACTLAHKYGVLSGLTDPALDVFIRLRPVEPEHISIVSIDESDFQNKSLFNYQLSPSMLEKVIRAIADGHPREIVVDLDTSKDEFKSLKDLKIDIPIIWAAVPARSATKPDEEPTLRVLGTPIDQIDKSINVGVAALREDPDGVVRHYLRRLTGKLSATHTQIDSLPWAALRQTKIPLRSPDANEMMLRFLKPSNPAHSIKNSDAYSRDNLSFKSVSTVDSELNCDSVMKLHDTEGWKNFYEGPPAKIVLLGGTFHAPSDTYITPIGRLPGLLINASIIETETQQAGLVPLSEVSLFLVEVAIGVLLAFINTRFSSIDTRIPLFSALGILAILGFLSWTSFTTFSLWFDFIPVLVAVQGYYLYEHIREFRRRSIELLNAEKKLVRAVDQGTEQERRRIAEELHDDTSSLFRQASMSIQRVLQDSSSSEKHVHQAIELLTEAQRNVREITQDLYPAQFEKFTMTENIERLVRRAEVAKLDAELVDEANGRIDDLKETNRLAVYRIIQEALTNIIKHSQAENVKLLLKPSDSGITLTVADDGKGLGGGREDSRGLETMRSRAALIGAQISWLSPSAVFGKGTDVSLVISNTALNDKPSVIE